MSITLIWVGIFTAHLLSRTNGWFGNMHASLVPLDSIILFVILLTPRLDLKSYSLFNALTLLIYIILPLLLTHIVITTTDPIKGAYTLLLAGSVLPLLLILSAKDRHSNFKSSILKFLDVLVYYVGRNLTSDIAFYPTIFLLASCSTPKSTQAKFIMISILFYLAIPSYHYSNDIHALNSLYSQPGSSNFKLLESRDSLTGRISVIEDNSQFGGIRVMKCDHSLLGGLFIAHSNASIFQVFYMMDYIRFIQPKKYQSKALLM